MSFSYIITVVIPAYNYAELIPRAIESVLNQKDDRAELLVVNDGSTDNTVEVVLEMQNKYPNKIRLENKENGGSASARNYGIDISRGEWLVFLDADDEMHDGALQAVYDHIEKNSDSRFIVGGHITSSSSGKIKTIVPTQLPEKPFDRVKGYLIDKNISLSNGACVMHRDVFESIRYPEEFRNAEDIPVFAQVLASFKCTIICQPLAVIHKHSDSLRHQFLHSDRVGLRLVDKVFEDGRMPEDISSLRRLFYTQRCLSLFRGAFIAKDTVSAKKWFKIAFKNDWRVVFKWSYSKKWLKILFNGL